MDVSFEGLLVPTDRLSVLCKYLTVYISYFKKITLFSLT